MNDTYVKSTCKKCGGKLEYLHSANGQKINCPHCNQVTKLGDHSSIGKTVTLIVFSIVAFAILIIPVCLVAWAVSHVVAFIGVVMAMGGWIALGAFVSLYMAIILARRLESHLTKPPKT